MKIHKKILIGIIVAMTIISMVAFYTPIRNTRTNTPSQSASEEQSSSLVPAVSSTSPAVTGPKPTSTKPAVASSSFEDMSGFSDLNQESDLLKIFGDNVSAGTSTDELNKTIEGIDK
jgi:cytoskeletal protein RodZ